MNKHINTFKNLYFFNNNIDDIENPSVSYIKDKDRLVIKQTYRQPTEDKTKAQVGDLVFLNDIIYTDDIEGGQPLYMDPNDPLVTYMYDQTTCLGVVVMPSDLTTDGKVRIVSLAYMDYNNTRYGNKYPVLMKWGESDLVVHGVPAYDRIHATVPGTSSILFVNNSFFATDFNLVDAFIADPDNSCRYDYNAQNSGVPTPYANGGAFNDYDYIFPFGSILGQGFNGEELTDALVECAEIDPSEITTINNQPGSYPAAVCCASYYSTELADFSIDAHYYLPSIAELGMLMARYEEIDYARRAVGCPGLQHFFMWSSSQCSIDKAWAVNFFLDDSFGAVDNQPKSINYAVLAFVAL